MTELEELLGHGGRPVSALPDRHSLGQWITGYEPPDEDVLRRIAADALLSQLDGFLRDPRAYALESNWCARTPDGAAVSPGEERANKTGQLRAYLTDPDHREHANDAMAYLIRHASDAPGSPDLKEIVKRGAEQWALVLHGCRRDDLGELAFFVHNLAMEPIIATYLHQVAAWQAAKEKNQDAGCRWQPPPGHNKPSQKLWLREQLLEVMLSPKFEYRGNGPACRYCCRHLAGRVAKRVPALAELPAAALLRSEENKALPLRARPNHPDRGDQPRGDEDSRAAAKPTAARPADGRMRWTHYALLMAYLTRVRQCRDHYGLRPLGAYVAGRLQACLTRGDGPAVRDPNEERKRGGRRQLQRTLKSLCDSLTAEGADDLIEQYRPFVGPSRTREGMRCFMHRVNRSKKAAKGDPMTAKQLWETSDKCGRSAYRKLLDATLAETITKLRSSDSSHLVLVTSIRHALHKRGSWPCYAELQRPLPGETTKPGVSRRDLAAALNDLDITEDATLHAWLDAQCDQLNTLCAELAAGNPLLSDAVAAPPPLAAV